MSGEAILGAESSGKPLGGRGATPNPAGGAHRASSDPLAGGEGVAAPPQEPQPRSLSIRPLDLAANEKSWTRP